MTTPQTDAERIGYLEAAYDKIGGPRPTLDPHNAGRALTASLELVGLLRDEVGPDLVGEWLDKKDRTQLYALVVTLGMMVPDDKTAAELLAWGVPEAAEEVRLQARRERIAREKAERAAAKAERERAAAERARAKAEQAASRTPRTRRTVEETRAADRARKTTPEGRARGREAQARKRARDRAAAALEAQAAEKASRRAPAGAA